MENRIEIVPVWQPTRQTRIVVPDFCVMHGGPAGMRLPEHEHADLQIETHFLPVPKGRVRERDARHSQILPSGKPHVGRWENGTEVIVCLLSREMLEQRANELFTRGNREIVDVPYTEDPLLKSLAAALRQEFLCANEHDPLFIESIGIVMSGHIVRQFGQRSGPRSNRGRLSAMQLRQAIDFIEERLTSTLLVSELAGRLGMSPHRFTRQFTLALGQTPYQFVLGRKVERAKALLTKSQLAIAEIALELNFCSQAHFTTVFRRRAGVTPLAFRERSDR